MADERLVLKAGMKGRYVVLRHTGGAVGDHFDLMLDLGGEGLVTWRIFEEVADWGGGVKAERLGDHRRVYMTYEGEVSGGRGVVKLAAAGEAEVVRVEGGECWVRLSGVGEVGLPVISTG